MSTNQGIHAVIDVKKKPNMSAKCKMCMTNIHISLSTPV